jgi:hypothetical protein
MRTITLVVFPDENRAVQGLAALEALHHQRSISVRGASLVQRDKDGLLLLREDTSGMLLGGGLGAVVARAPSELLEFLVRDLAPKTSALIAEASGEWLSKLGTRMEQLGGRVIAEWCMEAGDDERDRRTAREAEPAGRSATAKSPSGPGPSRE